MSLSPENWKQIEALYLAAVDEQPDKQAELIAQSAREIQEVVKRMLMQNGTAILDHPAWEIETQAMEAKLGPGSILGPYRLEGIVGAGGMGQVYRAWDTRLARKVAIKTIRAEWMLDNAGSRFLVEARAASALNHPNIITIYDVGSSDGLPYIVMEWIDGKTLRQKVAEGPMAVPEIFGVALQIVDALSAAHQKGVVHRDLKPENIMISEDGRAKVLDFGIAKYAANPDATAPAPVTQPGLIFGTPGYMSPEQARGEHLDFRSDQFSFGAVLYEMTTGRRAFAGNSAADVQAAILLRHPEPLTHLNRQAPAPLQWIVDRCLSKSPADRFTSTADLKSEFTAVVSGVSQRATGSVSNLPAQRNALIGRHEELSELKRLLSIPSLRLLTLTGPGGIGKTRLALELCHQVRAEFSGGVCFVPLYKVSQADLVPSEVALALGVTSAHGQIELAIKNHLLQGAAGPVLLLLDNFEQVLDAAPFVARLASERLKIVVTSRAALHVYGEYEFSVQPLPVGEESDAVRLFLERAPGLGHQMNDREGLGVLSEICSRLDGLPLAIELAAARTKLLSLKALRERLADPLALLVGGARDLPQRQQTLRSTLDWSFNLLDAQHQKLFQHMSVFVGGATIEAIEAVCDTRGDLKIDLWSAVELLIDNNLIRRTGANDEEPRFAMLETMREYGLERLSAANEDAYVRKAHAAYFLVLAEQEAPMLRRERTTRHLFDADLANFRAALDWLAANNKGEWGLRLFLSLGVYFKSLWLHREGLERISRFLALPGIETHARLCNWGRYWLIDFSYEMSGGGADYTDYAKLWSVFSEAQDKLGMHQTAHRCAFTSKFENIETAQRWAEKVVEIARNSFSPAILAGSLSNLADIVRIDRQFDYARTLYAEAHRLFRESGDLENATWSLSHEGDMWRDKGDLEQARSLYLQALDSFRRTNFTPGMASCLHDLGTLAADGANLAEAENLLQNSLHLYGCERMVDIPRVLESLAAVALQKSVPDRALVFLGAASALRDRFQVRTDNPPLRAKVEQCTAEAREKAGKDDVKHWMKGWNMTLEDMFKFAGNGEESWTTFKQP